AGYVSGDSVPEVYNYQDGYRYRDLNRAAEQSGKTDVLYGGVLWGCGTGGNEPTAEHAYSDFSGSTGQMPYYLTQIHALNGSC
ncbi:MAG: hypothetical protein ACYDGR_07800, partial [Candidatus Dormibacteria bacterium]